MIKLKEILEIKMMNGTKLPISIVKKNLIERLSISDDPEWVRTDQGELAKEINQLNTPSEFIRWIKNWGDAEDALNILVETLIQF